MPDCGTIDPMPPTAIDEAQRLLRRSLKGVLAFDEHVRPISIVIAPDGSIVAPVMVGMIEAADTVLFLPEESDDALQIQVTVEPFEERGTAGALADRWRIYHGEPPDVRWAVLTMDAARLGQHVFDGDALKVPNAMAAVEAGVCKRLNDTHIDVLRMACRRTAGKNVEAPRAVGVDQHGVDIRGLLDIFRIEAADEMATMADVLDLLTTDT